MGQYLFVTWDGGGNLPPALGIASELAARGSEVRFIGHPQQAARVHASGLAFTPFTSAKPFDSRTPTSPLALLGILADRGMGSDVVAAVRSGDVVVIDALLFGAMAAMKKAGRRYVAFEHTFDGYLRRAARGPLGLALRLRGLDALNLVDAGTPTIVASLAELDEGHGDVVHIGPVVTGVPAAPSRPTVLISLSTYAYRDLLPTWQRVLDAVDGLDAHIMATIGPSVDPTHLRVPAGVDLHQWLPHAEVMPRTSLVVCHGGHATTMAALAHDVPVLVVPLDGASDQATVGNAVARAGAGSSLSRNTSRATLRSTIEALLADGAHREAASDLGSRIRAAAGARRGADLLESRSTEAAAAVEYGGQRRVLGTRA